MDGDVGKAEKQYNFCENLIERSMAQGIPSLISQVLIPC